MKSISTGVTDTPIVDFDGVDVSLPALNFGEDLEILSEQPGEIVYTNVTAPTDQPEVIRLARRQIANIYTGTSIDPSAYLPTRRGVHLLGEVRQTWVETDSVDSAYRRFMPLRVTIGISAPAYGNIASSDVMDLVHRAAASLYSRGDDTDAGMARLLRGVLRK